LNYVLTIKPKYQSRKKGKDIFIITSQENIMMNNILIPISSKLLTKKE